MSDLNIITVQWNLREASRDLLERIQAFETNATLFNEAIKSAATGQETRPQSHFFDIRHVLVSANDLVKIFKSQHIGLKSGLSDSDLETIKHLRDLWEHRDEKPIQPGGKWNEKHAEHRKWLDRVYGDNWILAYSLTLQPSGDHLIGGVLPLSKLRDEAKRWLEQPTILGNS
jgi:hypothetical protein